MIIDLVALLPAGCVSVSSPVTVMDFLFLASLELELLL